MPHYNEPFASQSQKGIFILELKRLPSTYKVTILDIRTLKLERHSAHKYEYSVVFHHYEWHEKSR